MPKNQSQWCFAWFANVPKTDARPKAALVRASQWDQGETIEISFVDGDPEVQKRVIQAAKGWLGTNLANLQFAFRDDTNDTPIRISFQYSGSWSVIGTTCRQITNKSQPTMNFGWVTADSTDEEVRRVVLHEFGHGLGLIHEHQNPLGGRIQWNRDAVVADLSGPPNNWSADVIERNMFEPYKKDDVNGTGLDKDSIMMYPIPPTWTLDGFSVGLNSDLSKADKGFIHEQYP
jgi:hypothetical protein